MPKKLITPTEEAAAYLRHVTDIADAHKKYYDEHMRLARQAFRRGDIEDAQRCLADAKAERDSYYAAGHVARRWELPPPMHYVAPTAKGGLPDDRKHKILCGKAPRNSGVTCGAQGVTCPACIKLLLKEIDVQRLPKGWV